MRLFTKAIYASAVALVFLPAAQAEIIFGITNTATTQLFSFNSSAPGTLVQPLTTITGIDNLLSLRSIDFRPATGELYGFAYAKTTTTAGQLYRINTGTGVATAVGASFTLTGTPTGQTNFGMDFNPVIDRLRIISGTGTGNQTNYVIHPDTGVATQQTNMSWAPADPNNAGVPNVTAIAYNNNFAGATQTTLFGFEYNNDAFVRIGDVNGTPNGPSTGIVNTIGSAVFNPNFTNTRSQGFDISTATGIGYLNLDISPSLLDNLYTVDFGTGAMTNLGAIGGGLQVLSISVAAVPEPTTIALIGLGTVATVGAGLWRRRQLRKQLDAKV